MRTKLYTVGVLAIGLLAFCLLTIVIAWSIRRGGGGNRAHDRDHARAVALDTFCEVKRRDLEATARRLPIPAHRDAASNEFDAAFLRDEGQEALILCLGLPTWDRISPEGKAFTCSAAHDVACMTAMATAAAAALGSAAAE